MPSGGELTEQGPELILSPPVIVRLYDPHSLSKWKHSKYENGPHLDETTGVSMRDTDDVPTVKQKITFAMKLECARDVGRLRAEIQRTFNGFIVAGVLFWFCRSRRTGRLSWPLPVCAQR